MFCYSYLCLPLLSVFLANYFGERNNASEDTDLRFVTCQSLWNQIKLETEVSIAPNTKAVFCMYNNTAYLYVSGDLFYRLKGTIN